MAYCMYDKYVIWPLSGMWLPVMIYRVNFQAVIYWSIWRDSKQIDRLKTILVNESLWNPFSYKELLLINGKESWKIQSSSNVQSSSVQSSSTCVARFVLCHTIYSKHVHDFDECNNRQHPFQRLRKL